MDIKAFARENFLRLLAVICLLVGLGDTSRLVGLSTGAESPLASLGDTGFVFLAIFSVSRLFAAVGMWINSSWGGALLIGATLFEIVLLFSGSPNIHLSWFDILVRLGMLGSLVAYLGLLYLNQRDHVHD